MVIDGYESGSDITIMNTFYSFPTRDPETNKKINDVLAIIFKDNKTGVKSYRLIEKPNYTFYMLNDGEVVPDHPLFFIDKKKLHPVTVPYCEIDKHIAQLTDKMDFYNENIQNRNRYENKKLHVDPRIFYSDVNIEDHYRFLFSKEYTNNISKINKAFYDIECDTKYMAGDFVESGECPINCLSMLDERANKSFTFILRDSRNPLIALFEEKVKSGLFSQKRIHDFVTENVGGWKQAKRMGLDTLEFKLMFFDDELEMIQTFFQLVHQLSPDFIEGWNCSSFDLQYFIDRIYRLGREPAEIMCDPTWNFRMVKNFIDQRNINEFAERGDYAIISGLPVWLDQMIQFASRRKSKIGSFSSFKLDDIGWDVAKVRKLSYAHITSDLSQLPYLDFETFVLYNIMDVIVQKCIEMKSQDLEYLFSKCIVNNTVYRKGHRQTIYLINRMALEFDKLGFIIGNNVNRWNQKPEKFLGALVGNPENVNDYAKLRIDGRSIMVGDNVVDSDFKSLYPSLMDENNIAPNTQIGRIDIPEKVYVNENVYNIDRVYRKYGYR